ncbi:cysteine--tRNA ligase [Heliobacterium gestii]|uniref:Cysteine--tRNA ligase n=1 Tax=Heliomicrobium gestii TaxID=2699 RepID=A0A845LF56_HELGE|nr:cysteinyl-tRNA synthetase [Heliomicrobium gestii]MZP42153.1 cysteine--tRNA ligase [Heliomicrobium gestii]
MSLRLYNTLSREKETFVPHKAGRVGMYVCGPTTYDYIHLGNARPLVVFDTVRRYLEYVGYEVAYVQNFTDIDDKIINRAKEIGEDPIAMAARFVEEYHRDAKALNVRPATVHPKVSNHMAEIIAMIRGLEEKGHAYAMDGDVYFSIPSFKDYGKLSGRSLEDLQAGARVDVNERKRHPMDFALWKGAKPGEPSWGSPWGQGRPGWHIECSAMSRKYLGDTFDIHGGGQDLIFPHHENEVAQSEACTGVAPMARYWLHNGFITVNQEKMSKSLGNFFTLREILKKFPGDVIRFYLLSTHYRSPIDFDDGKLEAAQKGLQRLRTSRRLLAETLGDGGKADTARPPELREKLAEQWLALKNGFREAMDDDFNTALALSMLFDLAREVNTFLHGAYGLTPEDRTLLQQVGEGFDELAGVLGVDLAEGAAAADDGAVDGLMNLLIGIRAEARKKKDWAMADRIRDGLKELGIVIEDTPQGARWKKS